MHFDCTNSSSLDSLSVEEKLIYFLKANHSLLSLYLLSHKVSGRNIFKTEDMCVFIVQFILGGYKNLNVPIVVNEEIYSIIFGQLEGRNNILAESARVFGHAFSKHNNTISFEHYYYLEYLFSNKLYYLTNSREKKIIGNIVESIFFSKSDLIFQDTQYNDSVLHPLHDKSSRNKISRLISMKKISEAEEEPTEAITVFGLHRSVLGLGEDARRMFDMLTALGYRVELVDCSPLSLDRDEAADFYELFETDRPSAKIAIFCMPIFEMARIILRYSASFFDSRYIIGYWPWELTEFPSGWEELLEIADEVWASSRFLDELYKRTCGKPVFHVPLCVEIGQTLDHNYSRTYIDNNHINFISVFDFNSTIERKNPIGSIKAFKLAFKQSCYDARLILKSIHGVLNREAFDDVLNEIDGDPRITLLDGVMSKPEIYSLISCSTAFLSLHRSEGFGRLLVESMLLGTPVIATDWSGTQDFIRSGRGYPVSYKLRRVGEAEYPYAAGVWAEPDLDDAARIMKSIVLKNANIENVSKSALEFARASYSEIPIRAIIHERIKAISSSIKS